MTKYNLGKAAVSVDFCPHCSTNFAQYYVETNPDYVRIDVDASNELGAGGGCEQIGFNDEDQQVYRVENTELPSILLEFCPACRGILPLYSENAALKENTALNIQLEPDYCTILGITPKLILERREDLTNTLENLWLRKLNSNHPDRYINASEQSQRIAMQNAALCNEAYEILKDPQKTIAYFLRRAGYDLANPFYANKVLQEHPELARENFVRQEQCAALGFQYKQALASGNQELQRKINESIINEKNKLCVSRKALIFGALHKISIALTSLEVLHYADALRDYSEILYLNRAIEVLENIV